MKISLLFFIVLTFLVASFLFGCGDDNVTPINPTATPGAQATATFTPAPTASATPGTITAEFRVIEVGGVPVTKHLNAIVFLDEKTGFVAGEDRTVLKTTDGGVTWTDISMAPPPVRQTDLEDILTIDFYDENHGVIGGERGFLMYTDQGGGEYGWMWSGINSKNISSSSDDTSDRIHTVRYTSGLSDLIASTSEWLAKSEDGGSTYNTVTTYNAAVTACTYLPIDTVWIAGSDGIGYVDSSNGVESAVVTTECNDIDASDSYVAGTGNNTITFSSNNGSTWDSVTFPDMNFTGVNVKCTEDGGLTTGYIYATGTKYGVPAYAVSYDGGKTWEEDYIITPSVTNTTITDTSPAIDSSKVICLGQAIQSQDKSDGETVQGIVEFYLESE